MAIYHWHKNGLSVFNDARIVGGTAPPSSAWTNWLFVIGPGGADFQDAQQQKNGTAQFSAPAGSVADLEVLGSESRVTVTRLATLGLAGFGLRRNRTLIRLRRGDGAEVIVEVKADGPTTIALLRHFAWARELLDGPSLGGAAPANRTDVAAQIRELQLLLAEGAIDDDEFRRAKQQLLGD